MGKEACGGRGVQGGKRRVGGKRRAGGGEEACKGEQGKRHGVRKASMDREKGQKGDVERGNG